MGDQTERAATADESPETVEPGPVLSEPARRNVRRGAWVGVLLGGGLAVALIARYAIVVGAFAPRTSGGDIVPILVALLLFAACLAVVVFRPEREEISRMIATAAVWSVALFLAQCVLGYLLDVKSGGIVVVGTPLLTQTEVDAYLAEQLDPAISAAVGGRFQVPTGVLVQSLDVPNPQQVQVSGYIWQVYPPGLPSDITPGFALPEAINSGAMGEEVVRVKDANGEAIGWHFNVTLQQPFDYRHYPFDQQDVALRLWQGVADPRIVLVPDLAQYQHIAPETLPGITERFTAGGWEPIYSGFSFDASTPGIGGGVALRSPDLPDLYFNIGLKRHAIGPTFDQIGFAVVVALLLFAVLCLTPKEESTKSKLGISTFGVLGTCSGLLFAVIIKHNELRRAIAPDQVSFLEIVPTLLNLMIVLVALNAILLASPLQLKVLDYKNNLLPDLLYWPVLLGVLVTATMITFYY